MSMMVFIVGISGGIGTLLARKLSSQDHMVRGLVRRRDQQAPLQAYGVDAIVGDLSTMTAVDLARSFGQVDAIVFTAGSNGGSREVTSSVDGDGVRKAMAAAGRAGIKRFVLVSVLPEAWRERDLGDEVEYYFSIKKESDVAVSRSDLDWLILRPSLLVDGPGHGHVSLGPAELHDQITREDVADTLVKLIQESRISRQILELTAGPTLIEDAVQMNLGPRSRAPGPQGRS